MATNSFVSKEIGTLRNQSGPISWGALAGLSYKHPGPQEPGPTLVTLSCKGQWHLFTQDPTSLLGCAASIPLAPQ